MSPRVEALLNSPPVLVHFLIIVLCNYIIISNKFYNKNKTGFCLDLKLRLLVHTTKIQYETKPVPGGFKQLNPLNLFIALVSSD